MSNSATRSRIQAVIKTFLRNLDRDCPQLTAETDLHRDCGISSDEGVLLVIEIGEAFERELPEDFNAVIHDSGKRGRTFGELAEKVEGYLHPEGIA